MAEETENVDIETVKNLLRQEVETVDRNESTFCEDDDLLEVVCPLQ